jgi:hypothetical protein
MLVTLTPSIANFVGHLESTDLVSVVDLHGVDLLCVVNPELCGELMRPT